jgi:membrane protease YdiL (CAAX protease family)
MSTEPEFLPTTGVPPPPPLPRSPLFVESPRRIPNFGHTVLFFTIAVVVLTLTTLAAYAAFTGLHLLGNETAEQLMREPRMLIPSMALAYLVAGAIIWATFASLWQLPFLQALHWNFAAVQKHWRYLLAGGVGLSLVVQFLSNFLPIPKTLPIDDFFRNRFDVWMVALFGTFVAPLFEELAFRGFLLPSLASAWDWVRGVRNETAQHWSGAALVISCSITSIAFATVHADQLAHAWAPLAVLFAVSLVLCGVRLWANSLAASTLVHATYNGTIFTLLYFGTGGFRHLDKIT